VEYNVLGTRELSLACVQKVRVGRVRWGKWVKGRKQGGC